MAFEHESDVADGQPVTQGDLQRVAKLRERLVFDDSQIICKLALDRGQGGPVEAPAAFLCKHPPRQMTDDEAHAAVEAFIAGERPPASGG